MNPHGMGCQCPEHSLKSKLEAMLAETEKATPEFVGYSMRMGELQYADQDEDVVKMLTAYPATIMALMGAIDALEVIKSYGHLSEPEDRNKLVVHTVKFAGEALAEIAKLLSGAGTNDSSPVEKELGER